uniref:Uncharacterized protein n=1 Tax=Arcella intermedia TaxID=1963864 RepID=A0A6B2LCN1_9EUKA
MPFYKAPHFLTFNPFILTGYRQNLSMKDCLRSVFCIHNETGNIWTHLLGALMFGIYFIQNDHNYETFTHKTMFTLGVGACIICYFMSSIYHTFNCHSEKVFETLLYCDFMGIVLTICGVTAMTLFFCMRCLPSERNFYVVCCIILGVILLGTVVLQLFYKGSQFAHISHYFMILFCGFGFIPLVHWIAVYGFENPEVKLSIWKILSAYLFLCVGFIFWRFHIPERWFIGKCDIWFSSHQIWHIFVMLGPAMFLYAGHDAFHFSKVSPCLL